MNADKTAEKYLKLYRRALIKEGFPDITGKTRNYRTRLVGMLSSPEFAGHNVYPTMNVELIYAVIAMCLELRSYGLSNEQIIRFSETVFEDRRRFFDGLIRLIDLLPNSFSIARRWNINDHARRMQDRSIVYDSFRVTDNSVTYRISKCMYVEMFEAYGIRELCKIFCNTDTRSYAGLARHVKFIRHSDLSDGDSCYDEVYRK